MRLLDAKALEIVDVLDDVPPYAIISHTWGDEEVTIQQLRRLGAHSHLTSSSRPLDKKRRAMISKAGYIKITGAARLAISRGLDYLWIDTCCIDKTSSAELSEAINSMYQWYAHVESPTTQDTSAVDETVMEEDYFAILDCVKRDRDVHLCPALHLRRLSEDQYGRLQPKMKHFKRPVSSSYRREEGYRSVYIRQQPVYYHLPQFRLSPLNAGDGAQYRLVDKYPAHSWNAATMTLSVQYSRKLQAMGVFRFQRIDKPDDKVDVNVGLRRLNTMEWEGWCFQLACRDESLELTFQGINKNFENITHKSHNGEVTSATLRDFLGEDSTLASSASVEGVQLQGRLYISVLVTLTAELLAESATFHLSTDPVKLSRCNQVLNSPSPNAAARAMTEVYFWSSSSQSPLTWMVQPGRATSLLGAGAFMKPLYNFMSQLPRKRASAIEQLAEAVFMGDADRALMLIETRASDVNSRTTDAYGFAPLHWAVAGGSLSCVILLRKHGAKRKMVTEDGLSPIHIAALCNNAIWSAMVHPNDAREVLLDWSWKHTGSSPRNSFDETPLHRAAAGNKANAIEALVARSHYAFNTENVDQYGRTALWHAAAAGACNAIESLIRLGASVSLSDDLGRSPLHAACRGGHSDAVKLLRQHDARADFGTNYLDLLPMDLAAMFRYVDCPALFLDPLWRLVSQASLDRAVQIAAAFGQQACVERLCQYGANPYVAFEYYLRPSDGYAVVVEKKADAYAAAVWEQQSHIVDYFDTCDTLRDLRDRVRRPMEGLLDMEAAPDVPLIKVESVPAYILRPRQRQALDEMPHASNIYVPAPATETRASDRGFGFGRNVSRRDVTTCWRDDESDRRPEGVKAM
ncbi:putative ankyrin repeat-containing protein [Trichoderma austrokoningii]